MRLSEEQIKQGIIHPEQLVRDLALRYFAESFSQDPTVMPLAVQAVETHGWNHAFRYPYMMADLVQSDDTLLWTIDQLNRMGYPKTHEDSDQCDRLGSIIANSDLHLLMRHEERILGLEGLDSVHREVMSERLRLLTLDTASCWRELEAFCEDNKSNPYIDKVDLPHARRVAEAIARDESSAERVLSLLSQKIENCKANPVMWLEGLAIHIAGLMRLEAAVPMLVAKLKEDSGDLDNEECARAFVKVGTDATVRAIANEFPTAPWHFRLYASSSLGDIHSDLAVSKCQELWEREEDGQVRENLMSGVLGSFCADGIEPARHVTPEMGTELRHEVIAVATLMGVSFPEMAQWKEDLRKHDEEVKRRMQRLASETKPRASLNAATNPPPVPPIIRNERVGRNAPCPCKSGKKYKKCCGKNEQK